MNNNGGSIALTNAVIIGIQKVLTKGCPRFISIEKPETILQIRDVALLVAIRGGWKGRVVFRTEEASVSPILSRIVTEQTQNRTTIEEETTDIVDKILSEALRHMEKLGFSFNHGLPSHFYRSKIFLNLNDCTEIVRVRFGTLFGQFELNVATQNS